MIKLPMKVHICRNTGSLLDLATFNDGLSKKGCIAKREQDCLFDNKPCDAQPAILKLAKKG